MADPLPVCNCSNGCLMDCLDVSTYSGTSDSSFYTLSREIAVVAAEVGWRMWLISAALTVRRTSHSCMYLVPLLRPLRGLTYHGTNSSGLSGMLLNGC